MIDRDLQVEMLLSMQAAGGTVALQIPDGADEQKYARNLLDLELQGFCTGGVSATAQGFRVQGESTITDAGRQFLARPENVQITMKSPDMLAALRQRVASDPTLSEEKRHELHGALDGMHPLTLRALGRDLLDAALEDGPHAVSLLRKHSGT
ncbi:hypothetical protein K6L44_11735 [Gluconacetobacter entanii]|uniref:Uncharacterized protein n=1 Tax=Gluconacetobacter entanii TaxID=108528 RepID=A0A318PUF1_9PROT|nr:hypothetical protein [Gluconacetobacter entanii]MBE7618317.1 hypothetical protein [Komagataeibacter sp. FXV2]MCE2578597.1 hypothetical protein [Komagataeibacter sp. FNDCR1]MBY4640641.1 hypothetical protein [Gluconacetobacter entanii]MCW4581494.1 hypothetical protein [Gluconacetobacter entanii]MCW4584874.1 hypothetical protein [Gluconacetobacter entanii]